MKLAIMQPYFFPYLGYFQLVNAVDKFISYDDVNFIKQGWINRNRILVCGHPQYFTVPIKNISSFSHINETQIANDRWKIKFLKSVKQSYAKASFFKDVYALLESLLTESHQVIATLALASIKSVCQYLGIKTEIIHSSAIYNNNHLNGIQRILHICGHENAKHYLNLSGGMDLYPKKQFAEKNVQLSFIQSNPIQYRQNADIFVPNLSMIDVLMHNSKADVSNLLREYKLL